jgi:hypothetical protein
MSTHQPDATRLADPEGGSNESRALTILSKLKTICSNDPNCGFTGDEIDHLSSTFEEVLFNAQTRKKVLKEEIKMQESLKALGKDASAYMLNMFQNRVHRENKELKLRNSEGELPDVDPESTRVVGHLIICKPSSTNIETTKGERLLGRRRVVGGYMLKKGETTKAWASASVKRRYFVLDADELSYYRTESEITDEGSQMKLIRLKEVVGLRPTLDESAPALAVDMDVRQSNGTTRTFVFAPEGTDEEMKGWARHIALCCPPDAVVESIHTMSRETLTLVTAGKSSADTYVTALGITSGQVLEGWMFKKGETSKPWTSASVKRRYFVLQGQYLKYFASDHLVNSQAPIKTIDLTQATFLGYTRDATAPGAAMDLKVRLPNGFERVFVFSPVGESEKRINWATNLAEAVPRVALEADLAALMDGFVEDDEGLDRVSDEDADDSAAPVGEGGTGNNLPSGLTTEEVRKK